MQETAASEVCLKAIALWRPSIVKRKIGVGQTPLIVPRDMQQPSAPGRVTIDSGETAVRTNSDPSPQPLPVQPETTVPHKPLADEYSKNWEPITNLSVIKGASPPIKILFPDDTTAEIQTWGGLTLETARWLIDNDFLNARHCPVRVSSHPRTVQYLVSEKPVHSNDREFTSFEELTDNYGKRLFIFTGLEAPLHVRSIKYLVGEMKQDPSQFKVRFSS